MLTVCPSCRHQINETSAVMLQGGLVYHQRCAPGSPAADQPLTVSSAAGSLLQVAAWSIAGIVLVASAVAFWPVALAVLIVVAIIKYAACEFAKAARRS